MGEALRLLHELGDAEVHDPDLAVPQNPDVGRLDVPVHHAPGVGVTKAVGNLEQDA